MFQSHVRSQSFKRHEPAWTSIQVTSQKEIEEGAPLRKLHAFILKNTRKTGSGLHHFTKKNLGWRFLDPFETEEQRKKNAITWGRQEYSDGMEGWAREKKFSKNSNWTTQSNSPTKKEIFCFSVENKITKNIWRYCSASFRPPVSGSFGPPWPAVPWEISVSVTPANGTKKTHLKKCTKRKWSFNNKHYND